MNGEGNKYKKYFNSLLPRGKSQDKGANFSYDKNSEIPSMYEIYISDSGDTPKEFVAEILEKFFHKEKNAIKDIMDVVYCDGAGACGRYTRDVAETKVLHVTEHVYGKGFLLECTMQKSRNNVI